MDIVVVGAALILVTSVVLSRMMHTDLFKDRVFQIREAWFDLALDERSSLEFDSRLYRSLERVMCTMLRLAGFYSVFALIYIVVRSRLGHESATTTLQDELSQINDTYTMRESLEIWGRLTHSLHAYLCSRSLVYAIWTILVQPAKEPTQPLLSDEIAGAAPFLRAGATG